MEHSLINIIDDFNIEFENFSTLMELIDFIYQKLPLFENDYNNYRTLW